MNNEIWKDVVGFEGKYQVSNLGYVRNSRGKVLKPNEHNLGYLSVKLTLKNEAKNFFIHRLVALAFLTPDTLENNEVDHLNGNKKDNRLLNLEWVSRAENMKRASLKGLLKYPDNSGAKNGMARLSERDVKKIKNLKDSDTQENIARMFGVTRRAIGMIYSGKRWADLV